MARRLRLGLVALCLAASLGWADADQAVAPLANPPAAAPKTEGDAMSLQGFGAQNPLCREWSDGCAVCLRDAAGAAHCSTPGVACEPTSAACR